MDRPLVRTVRGLDNGESAVVYRIAGAPRTAKRLADLGFVRGATLHMLRAGVPCLIRIAETCVGLGVSHQECIELSP